VLLEQTRTTLVERVTQHVPLTLVGLGLVCGAVSWRCWEVPLPLGRAEGDLPVLWLCVVEHHLGRPPPPWAGPRVPRKFLSGSHR
jgi:hypothetical protein